MGHSFSTLDFYLIYADRKELRTHGQHLQSFKLPVLKLPMSPTGIVNFSNYSSDVKLLNYFISVKMITVTRDPHAKLSFLKPKIHSYRGCILILTE